MIQITKNWYEILKPEFEKEYFKKLQAWLNEEYSNHTIFPPYNQIFNALNQVKYSDVKVVIIGQDPYHEIGQAMGMSFSVPQGIPLPPSLKNIYKEIENEFGITCEKTGDLTRWAKQGVLLLNAVLTVRQGQANSHKGKGWENITSQIIKKLNERTEPVIFMLWGSNAKAFEEYITNKHHYVLKSAHPSPLSAYNGFFGNNHFKQCNIILQNLNKHPIMWQ
ncbi:MAG: uracil-DNA glycosylase [Clostridiales bacterium]|nr:uracil-DNA glycosylase [Clostridiales bacterium]